MPEINLPYRIKEQLLDLSRRLPPETGSRFLAQTASRLNRLSLEHENALIGIAAGFIIGEMIDNFLSVEIPWTEIDFSATGDYMSHIMGMIGGWLGTQRDAKRQELRYEEQGDIQRKIAEIISSELRLALGGTQ